MKRTGGFRHYDSLEQLKAPEHQRGEWPWTYMKMKGPSGWLAIIYRENNVRYARLAFRLPAGWGWLVSPAQAQGPHGL